jgi:purine nucleoside permease
MTDKPTDYELMDLYRTWWKDSYGTQPNSQATIIAAAWARYVLDAYPNGKWEDQ